MKTNRVFYVALFVSVVVHLLLMQLFSYQQDVVEKEKQQQKAVMDVALLSPETPDEQTAPEHVQAIANKNQQAKRELEANELKARMAAAPKPKKTASSQSQHQKQIREKNQLSQQESKRTEKKDEVKATEGEQQQETKKTYKPLSELDLNPSNAAINKISKNIQKEQRLQSMLSSEADIPINTREEKYAPYAHALVRALEEQWRPGKEDYQIYSDIERQVLLRITINRQGTLEQVEVLRPSPIASLNASALKALRDAAPYHALPSSWGFDRVTFKLTFQLIADRAIFRTH